VFGLDIESSNDKEKLSSEGEEAINDKSGDDVKSNAIAPWEEAWAVHRRTNHKIT
jgi:hypothetical protein